jgi:hypothetical protein
MGQSFRPASSALFAVVLSAGCIQDKVCNLPACALTECDTYGLRATLMVRAGSLTTRILKQGAASFAASQQGAFLGALWAPRRRICVDKKNVGFAMKW